MVRSLSFGKENTVQNAICEYLTWRGVFFYRHNNMPVYDLKRKVYRSMGRWSKKGVSDIVGIYKERPLYIEVKGKSGRTSEEQDLFLLDVQMQGGIAFVARNVQDVIDNLSKYS